MLQRYKKDFSPKRTTEKGRIQGARYEKTECSPAVGGADRIDGNGQSDRSIQSNAGRPVLIQESPLAGFQYYAGEQLWTRLRKGDPLSLRRTPDNPYDAPAVEVHWKGHMLGHIPRREKTAISQMLDWGEHLTAYTASLRYEADPWGRITLTVEAIPDSRS